MFGAGKLKGSAFWRKIVLRIYVLDKSWIYGKSCGYIYNLFVKNIERTYRSEKDQQLSRNAFFGIKSMVTLKETTEG